jgi:hypothetical protein
MLLTHITVQESLLQIWSSEKPYILLLVLGVPVVMAVPFTNGFKHNSTVKNKTYSYSIVTCSDIYQ